MGTPLENRKNLSRQDIVSGLKRLSELARDSERMIDIAVYGGSAIMLAWDMRAMTNDVDAIVMDASHTEFVRLSVSLIAEEMGWHDDWLNDAIKGYIRVSQDMMELPLLPEQDGGGLRIYVPTPEYFLAMKCVAMRLDNIYKSDGEDIKNMIRMLDITSPDTVLGIVEKYYPQNVILPRVKFGVLQLFAEIDAELKNTNKTSQYYEVSHNDIDDTLPDRKPE